MSRRDAWQPGAPPPLTVLRETRATHDHDSETRSLEIGLDAALTVGLDTRLADGQLGLWWAAACRSADPELPRSHPWHRCGSLPHSATMRRRQFDGSDQARV